MVQMPYQNVKSIRQAVFKLPHSQAMSCIGYNGSLQTAVAAIFIFVEYPKLKASEVLVVLRAYQTGSQSDKQFSNFRLHKQYPVSGTLLICKLLWWTS